MKTRLCAIAVLVIAWSLGAAVTITAQGTTQHWAQVTTLAGFPYYTGFESDDTGQ